MNRPSWRIVVDEHRQNGHPVQTITHSERDRNEVVKFYGEKFPDKSITVYITAEQLEATYEAKNKPPALSGELKCSRGHSGKTDGRSNVFVVVGTRTGYCSICGEFFKVIPPEPQQDQPLPEPNQQKVSTELPPVEPK